MPGSNFDKALLQLHKLLSLLNIEWILLGTAGIYLLKYNVEPNDIDILVKHDDAPIIKQALKAFKTDGDTSASNRFRSDFSKYTIEGVNIEIMGGLEVNTISGWLPVLDMIKTPQKINYKGEEFLIPGKSDQVNIYKTFNREKDKKILVLLSQDPRSYQTNCVRD